MMAIMQYNPIIDDPSMGVDPSKNAINRLVSTRRWSVENSAKWITDEHEEGMYDYEIKNLEEEKDDSK
jgi:hypothetical protein